MPVESAASVMRHVLEIVEGPERGLHHVWDRPRLIVGREQDCQITLCDAAVSRHHCVFLKDEYAVRLRDLGSRNGTSLNGRRVQSEQILQSGDVVVVGQTKIRYLEVAAQRDVNPQATATNLHTKTVTSAQILM